jgi:hypothetical protein
MSRRVAIVFEETEPQADGMGFNVYLEGHDRMLDPNDLPAAEFWARKMFAIVGQLLQKTGAAQEVIRPNAKGGAT